MITKKKLAIFSPLPPTKSGISDYSIDLGLALSEYFNIIEMKSLLKMEDYGNINSRNLGFALTSIKID